ncbi:MFS transporter [Listeria kieliensis]|uniref:MFS transporter n=1 Tax=Listeria kieliensis TaxID=1621700 RepID=A0A3D8TRH4_9LIST|nr:MFS transporter [Listeria kieliensis]RDX00999.1 MFS transporter [Listeria kieliensis]
MTKKFHTERLALISIMLGAFISLLDTTVVNVALPDITKALHASSASIEWVVSGYALAFGLILILAGRLGDKFGRKNLYILGISLFLLMSITAGFAQSETSLILSRIIQGLSAGLFFPQINAMMMDIFKGDKLGQAFGVLGSVIGVATAIGPFTGGLLIQLFGTENGWRFVFFVNVPFVIVTLILAALFLPKRDKASKKVSFDFLSVFLLTVGLLFLLYPVISNGSEGFKWQDILFMLISIPILISLYSYSIHVTKKGKQPLISPTLLKNKAFTSGIILSLVYFAAFTSIFFIFSLTWQSGFGRSAIVSGLAVSPFALGSMLAAANSNRFMQKLGRKLLIIGLVFVMTGLATTSFIFHLKGGAFSPWLTVFPLFLAGLGSGLIISPLNSFTLATVSGSDRGGASGIFNTAQRVGSSFGIAIVGSIYFRSLSETSLHNVAEKYSFSLQMSIYINLFLLLICLLLVFKLPKKNEA